MKKLYFLILIGILISCNDDENFNTPPVEQQTEESETPSNIDLSDKFGAEIQRDFIGEVLNENQAPIPGAKIQIGNSFATTDQNGVFIIYYQRCFGF